MRASTGLLGSSRMWVAAVCSIPLLDFVHVFPPSTLVQTPPRYFEIPVRLHIFGRGRSCVPLFTLQTRPFTSGSSSIQYVVFTQSFGTPLVELIHDLPASSLRNSPISVIVMNCLLRSNGSK